MYKKVFIPTIVLFVLSIPLCSLAQPYYYWYHDYIEAPPNSLAVWNFNQPLGTVDLVAGIGMELSGWAGLSEEEGKFGGSFYNVGGQFSEDYGQARDTTIFPEGTDPDLSIEFWLKLNDVEQQAQYLIDKAYSDPAGYKIRLHRLIYGTETPDPEISSPDYKLEFVVGNGTTDVVVTTLLSWEVDKWYHIACTWNAQTDTGKLFRDGVEVYSIESPGMSIVNATTRFIKVGNRRGSTYWSLNGYIDNLRIADVAHEYALPDPQQCGDYGTYYFDGDVSSLTGERDCRVDLYDFAVISADWLMCTDPNDTGCDEFWK